MYVVAENDMLKLHQTTGLSFFGSFIPCLSIFLSSPLAISQIHLVLASATIITYISTSHSKIYDSHGYSLPKSLYVKSQTNPESYFQSCLQTSSKILTGKNLPSKA